MTKEPSFSGSPGVPAEPAGEASFTAMSLRDYFAAQALQGLCVHYATPNGLAGDPDRLSLIYAEYAYRLADAMLVERGRGAVMAPADIATEWRQITDMMQKLVRDRPDAGSVLINRISRLVEKVGQGKPTK